MGIPIGQLLAAWRARAEDDLVEVEPDMLPALRLFSASATQWRHVGMSGVPTGLDYAGVQAAAAMLGQAMTPEIFSDLRHLEAGALDAMAEDREP